MIIYENSKEGFLEDVMDDCIVEEIKRTHREKGMSIGGEAEIRSWQNSLQFMYKVLSGSDVPDDSGVAIEYKVPLMKNQIDFMISGNDDEGNSNIIIIELKQWNGENTEVIDGKDGYVETVINGAKVESPHPSYQAWSYSNFIEDFNVPVQENKVNLDPLAYLHNFEKKHRETLEDENYEEYIEEAPLYLKGDARKLRTYLEKQIKEGDDRENIYKVDNGKVKPSKSLQDSITGMLDSKDEFTLIDSQKIVFEKAVKLAKESARDSEKKVMIVEGGPGTGKTVVAINILSELLDQEMFSQYISKNATPRKVYLEKLSAGDWTKKAVKKLFTSSGGFHDEEEDSIPALITDEAHRLNAKSGMYSNKGENQIKEIINTGKFSIFFIDESQRVHIDDIGSKQEIRKHASQMDAEIIEAELKSQFRCQGSQGYIAWLDDVLEIRDTANTTGFDLEYDLKIFDTPEEMHQAIREKESENGISRVVAGYCWSWDTDNRDDPEHYDIKIGDYEKSWNLDDDSRDPWAIDSGSLEEVGCIHTCQGLEFEYVGVIIGPDMKYRDGEIVVDFEERYSHDSSIRGLKKMYRENPEKAEELEEEIIKNTYRTLMSRGMKGCYIYCVDDQLQEYVKDRLSLIK